MLLVDATAADIAGMNERLEKKRTDKKAEKEMDQVVRMVQKHPFVKAPQEVKKKMNDYFFFNGLKLLFLAFVGALIWNLTGYYFFLFFFAAVLFMAVIEFKKSFT